MKAKPTAIESTLRLELQFAAMADRLAKLNPLGDEHQRSFAVGITSCHSQAGVSTVARNLALAATDAVAGPVLLVDAHVEASKVTPFGVPNFPGLTDVLSKSQDARKCIHTTANLKLFVMPIGNRRAGMTAWIRQSDGTSAFEALRREFAFIVVDLPPVNPAGGSIRFASALDGFVLVLAANRMRLPAVRRVREQFAQGKAPLLGCVMNRYRRNVPAWLRG